MFGIGELLLGESYPPFTLGLNTTSTAGGGTSSTVVSGSVQARPEGGSGQFEGTWSRTDGDATILPLSPNSLTTAWQCTSMSIGKIWATFICTVKDKVTGETKPTGTVTVTMTRGYPSLSVSTPTAIFGQTPSSSPITVSGSTSVSVSGGSGSYTFSWSSSGDFNILPDGAWCGAYRLLSPQGSVQGSVSCTVRDTVTNEQATVSAPVQLINNGSAPPPISISASSTNLAGYGNTGYAETASVTFTVSGGVGPFVINVSGGPGSVGSPSGSGRSHSTNFACYGIPVQGSIGASFTATVYDQGNNNSSASAGVSVVFYNFGLGPFN